MKIKELRVLKNGLLLSYRKEKGAQGNRRNMQLLSIPNAAKKLGCSTPTVRTMIRQGTLPTVRIGRRHKVEESTLYRWIADGGAKERKLIEEK